MDDNEKYIGYCVDLLEEISKRLNFKYKIQEARTPEYGKFVNKNSTNGYKWNGAMGDLLAGVI